jgi:hypothetical protein
VEPVHTGQASQLDLTQWPIGFTPPEGPFDQFAFLVTDGTPRVVSFSLGQTVHVQIALSIFVDMRSYLTLAQCLDERLFLIKGIAA